MKSLHRIAIAAPLIVLHAWAGEIPSKQIAARTELHQIQTLTLSDQQFLNGDTGGKPVTITGQLRIAQGLAAYRRLCSSTGPAVTSQTSTYGQGSSTSLASRHLRSIVSPGGGLPR